MTNIQSSSSCPVGSYREVGPLEQSLFLGCSITNFNMNLAWGEDSSSLTVTLVEDTAYHPASTKYNPLSGRVSTVNQPNSRSSEALRLDATTEEVSADVTRNLLKPISLNLEEQAAKNMDPGKICKGSDGIPARWLGPDPGFLGLPNKFSSIGYDLIGVPAVFWFEDIYFGGLITSWKAVGSQGGSPTYEIEMKNGSSLLKGCQLIIDAYAGTVSSSMPNTSDNYTGENISVPSHYDASASFLPHNATLRQGNLPNVFNIYGYWEQVGFGNAGRTDNGIPAINIYNALVNMLAPGTTDTNPFFPYGAILGRTLTETNGTFVNVNQAVITDADGRRVTLKNCGICPGVNNVDGVFHGAYKLDLSAVPAPPPSLYTTGPVISLMQFISDICDGAGFDFFISLEPAPAGSNCSGVFKINTVSRRLQPQKNVIKNFVSALAANGLNISSYSYGQEYADQTTRSMYLGGPQKRLLQFKTTSLVSNQTTLVFDPFSNGGVGSFLNYGNLGQPGTNQARMPSFLSTRRYSSLYSGGAAVAENPPGNYNDQVAFTTGPNPIDPWTNSRTFSRGNYTDGVSISTVINLVASSTLKNHPLYTDMICPYFGQGADGLARKVYFDPGLSQVQILFDMNDLKGLVSAPIFDGIISVNPKFLVLENELRAAGKGFDQWLTYCFDNFFSTDISEICYQAFRQSYGNYGSKSEFISGLRSINWANKSKQVAVQNGNARGGQVGLENLTPFTKTLYSNLQAIHKFFANIAMEHYGKTYMVKIPSPRYYQDTSLFDNGSVMIADGIYAKQGTGKIYPEWQISADGAWEEPGNWIDDTLIVGSTIVNAMSDDQGKIPPILGFSSHPEVNCREKWVAEKNIMAASLINSADCGSHIMTDWVALLNGRNATSATDERNNYYTSIHHSLPAEEYVDIPYRGVPSISYATAHGKPMPQDKVYKTYTKASCQQDFVFLEPEAELRVVISVSSPVYIGNHRNFEDVGLIHIMQGDALNKVVKGSSIPTPMINPLAAGQTTHGGLRRYPYPDYVYMDARSLIMHRFNDSSTIEILFGSNGGQITNESSENTSVLNKAANPFFAAIPVESVLATYGPWTNHPGLIENNIFGGRTNPSNDVNNLVGGIKVNHDAGLVPWNYGGMDALDAAVMAKIKDDVNYQQTTEQGSIQVPGAILLNLAGKAFNLGHALASSNDGFGGPIISSIQVQVGEGGITTNYNMRTYTRKLGFYNKENADRIKAIGAESLKRRKELSTSLLNVLGTLNNGPRYGSSINSGPGNIFDAILNHTQQPKMYQWSPFEILAGANSPIVHPDSAIGDIYRDLNYSPGWSKMPFVANNISYDPKNMIRESTNVSLQDVQELPRELKHGYANKSMMSLDGLLSPISFYPTPHGATFSITKYPRPGCPFCKGTAKYSYNFIDPDASITSSNININTITNSITSKTVDCPFCETIEDKTKKQLVSASPKETNPPYILASGDDLTLIGKNNLGTVSGLSGNPIINYGTLNPVLMSVGEFSSYPNRQLNDLTGHSIDLIGQGLTAPEGDNGLKPAYSKNIERSFLDYDQNYMDFTRLRGMNPATVPANNMRYFGLRGPLMVHGWGYDLEGYPVPNASGEPKVVNGEIVKDRVTGKIIYKNQTQKPDGTWTEPYKEHQFYKGWGQLPSTWPVGPVDLRWDANAGVWTVGANYKPVWVVLETDLVNRQPSRGAIIEDSYTNDPLPEGLRKLVFVQDNLGINPAPRKAPVYCKYNGQNGFYEPVYNKTYTTSGTIQGNTSVSIYNIYQDPNNTIDISYLTTFGNPMGFSVSNGDLGMFNFINGSWILQSVNC
jgi:hypothetical protein